MAGLATQVKFAATSTDALIDALGLRHGASRVRNGWIVRCPWHSEKTASCSIQLKSGIVLANCFGCGANGDAIAVWAAAKGMRMGDAIKDMAAYYGLDSDTLPVSLKPKHAHESLQKKVKASLGSLKRDPSPTPTKDPEPELIEHQHYVPHDELLRFLQSTTMCHLNKDVAAWLRSRHFSPDDVDMRGLGFALGPDTYSPDWATIKGKSWYVQGYDFVVPVFDYLGECRGVRASRIVDSKLAKRIGPTGYSGKGLVMADALGQHMLLCGDWPGWFYEYPAVTIAEGEPDFITCAIRNNPILGCWDPIASRPMCPRRATLGIYAGSWSEAIASRIPDRTRVLVIVDDDQAGHRYAKQIADTLRHRTCFEVLLNGKEATNG